MNIKNKLRLGFGFMFVIVITFGGISLYHINQISMRSKIVLKDNYKSLVYVNQMRTLIDNQFGKLNEANKVDFDRILKFEENNVTEKGEKEAVIALRKLYNEINITQSNENETMANIKIQLRHIDEINMNAIIRKNDSAQNATERASLYLGLTAFITFIILFSFIVNFPGFIANPLGDLLRGIQEISNKNYKQQLHFKGNDEFNERCV